MLPRGDGAGQHLCEGDLGYKTKQKPNLDSSQIHLLGELYAYFARDPANVFTLIRMLLSEFIFDQ